MTGGTAFLPVEAAKQAGAVDVLFYGEVGISVLVSLIVACLVVGFVTRYRRGSPASRRKLPQAFSHEVEIIWTVGTFFAFVAIFWWAATLNLIHLRPPDHTLDIRVVAKQWMWKIEQPNGVREIDAMHLPVDTPVRLIMTSQDVIHSFYVSAFRAKQDVVPGRVETLWFTPDRIGTYQLLCAEYCGLGHSLMRGEITVMSKADYARWCARMKAAAQVKTARNGEAP